MSKSTPLNQLPSYASNSTTDDLRQLNPDQLQQQQPDALRPNQQMYGRYPTGIEDDSTVQEVMGDLASSIPGFMPPPPPPIPTFAPPPSQPVNQQLPMPQPAAAPLQPAQPSGGGILSSLMGSAADGQAPCANERLFQAAMAAVLFVLVSVAPIEKLLALHPVTARFASTHATLLIRAALMSSAFLAAAHFTR